MDMLLKEPTAEDRKDWSGDADLAWVMKVEGSVPYDRGNDGYGEMTVTIDREGFLCFEFYVSAYQPWDEMTVLYGKPCDNVEAAKGIAEIVLLDIENTTDQRWAELGFMKDVV